MNGQKDLKSDSASPPPGPVLEYSTLQADASPSQSRRPGWVYAIASLYLLMLAGLLSVPFWMDFATGAQGAGTPVAVVILGIVGCGLILMQVPSRKAGGRPLGRNSIWAPLVISGILAGLLALGAGLCVIAYVDGDKGSANAFKGVCAGAGFTWFLWTLLFGLMAFPANPGKIALKLHRWLIAGSVVELLIAVPTHIIVRRRSDCCASLYTGTAICLGVAVMIVALGPAVFLLYYNRYRRVRKPRGRGAGPPTPQSSVGEPEKHIP